MKLDRHPQWLIIAVIWACIGALLVIQLQTRSDYTPFMYAWAYGQQIARALFWAVLTPSVLRWLEAWPLGTMVGWLRHLGASVGLFILFLYARLLVAHFIDDNRLDPVSVWRMTQPRALLDIAFYWSIIAVGWVISINIRRARAELHEAQLRSQLANAELAALKQQLQPHFLFNCLNATSALMRDGQTERAVEALAKLSGLMRALMQSSGVQEVALAREVDYVQRYLDLERLRFDERLEVRFDIGDDTLSLAVPTLLLQPLVENAIKHGLARRRSPGRITVRAYRVGPRLVIEVENDPPEGSAPHDKPAGQGLGLTATRSRLARMFGPEYGLETIFASGAPASVRVVLPCREMPSGE